MKKIILTIAVTVLAACSNDDAPKHVNAATGASTRALPFLIETVSLSDLFKNNLKVATVNVGVTGGVPSEWAATSIAIAEKVATFGADSIEVSIRRNEITQPQGVTFREVVHTYYNPNPNRSVWDDNKQWTIYVADQNHLATQKDVAISDEFQELNQKLIDKGLDVDMADKKAGAAIAKKFNLPKDWRLPIGNMSFNGDGMDRKSLSVSLESASESLDALGRCLDGKIIRMLVTCRK
jgi:hypothetical protein